MENEVDRIVDKKETKPCTCKAADNGVFGCRVPRLIAEDRG